MPAYTVKHLAREVGRDPEFVRRVLRASGIRAGSGGRHVWTEAEFRRMSKVVQAHLLRTAEPSPAAKAGPAEPSPPSSWPEGDTRLALSIVVNVEEGSEMSVARGDPGPEPVDELGVALRRPIRNHGNESNYLYGLKAGAPRVLALLERYGAAATFTAAAMSLENEPALARRIAAGPHEVCSHGWRWIHQHRFDEAEERAFIRRAAGSIERTTGSRPRGWLSRYLLTDHTRRLLAEEGFAYHMDDYSDDAPFWDEHHPILVVPYALDSNDMKMWTEPALTPRHWLEYAVDTFDWLWREGRDAPRMMSLGLHLRIIGRPGRIGYLERFLEHAAGRRGVWFATRAQIADAWARAFPRPEHRR